jgi:hypothetical protein
MMNERLGFNQVFSRLTVDPDLELFEARFGCGPFFPAVVGIGRDGEGDFSCDVGAGVVAEVVVDGDFACGDGEDLFGHGDARLAFHDQTAGGDGGGAVVGDGWRKEQGIKQQAGRRRSHARSMSQLFGQVRPDRGRRPLRGV